MQPMISTAELDELSNLFQNSIAAWTINRVSDIIASCCCTIDFAGFTGLDTTLAEFMVFDDIFKLNEVLLVLLVVLNKNILMENKK